MASVAKRKWTHKGITKEAWVVRYKDRSGAHRSRQFDQKKPADAFRREVENELDAGTHVARRESRTVAAAIDEYHADIERRAREGKVGRAYVTTSRNNLAVSRDRLGGILLRDLNWQQVERFYHELQRTNSAVFKRPFSPSHIRNIMSQLGTMMAWAVRRGYAARNVVADAKREIGAPAPEAIETFTRDEIKTLLECLERYEKQKQERIRLQLKAMVYIAVACGLRKGEIAGLTWDAIDLKQGLIHVRQSTTYADELKGPKTKASRRTVPMPLPVQQALVDYAPHVVTDSRGLIFRSRKGGEIMRQNLYRTWWRFLRTAGLPRRHFHALRHFAGSAWLDARLPITEVSRLLGHANVAVTAKVYSHVITETNYRPPEVAAAMALIAPPSVPAPITQALRIAA